MEAQTLEEVCPSCGNYVTYIVPATGWCFRCTWSDLDEREAEEGDKCETCGNATDESHKFCRSCRHNSFLEKHGDEIDMCISFGLSVTRALQLIRQNERILCKSCGGAMRKASNGVTHFCTENQECRTAQRKLKYLIYEKGIKKDEALAKVLEGIK